MIVHGRDWDDAYAAAAEDSRQTGRYLIHPFNDPYVMAGQGTVGLELLADCGTSLDAIVVAIGGGGLISGIAAAAKESSPNTVVVGVEPNGAASMTAAIEAGRVVELKEVRSIADTLSPRGVGDLTLEAARRYVDRIVLIDAAAMCRALQLLLQLLWNEFNLLVEPSGAAALAVLLEGASGISPGSKVGVVVSGGDIDVARFWINFG